jgi:hypothetical protein
MLLKELLKGNKELKATVIFSDNQGAITLAKNPQFYARIKHIDISHHYVRQKQADNTVDLCYIPTNQQVADSLTNALPKDSFIAFRKALGLQKSTT